MASREMKRMEMASGRVPGCRGGVDMFRVDGSREIWWDNVVLQMVRK